jgi:hypothetical protein
MVYRAVTPIGKSSKKAAWHTIGRAWSDGPGKICIVLDSVPFRSEYVYLFVDEEATAAWDKKQAAKEKP